MNTAYLMIAKYSGLFYSLKAGQGTVSYELAKDARKTVAEAVSAFFEDEMFNPLYVALNPKQFFILTLCHNPHMQNYVIKNTTRLDKIDPALLEVSV